MKTKKPNFEELKKMFDELRKDPKLIESIKEFIRYHGGNPDSR